MHWEARMRRLAALQLGVIGIHQMRTIDADHRSWTRARRNGRWEAVSGNVLRLDGMPVTAEQRAFAGVLDAGPTAFLFGEPAMAWFGLRNRRLEPVDIGRVRSTSNRPGALARCHRLRDLRAADVVLVRGLPVLSPMRLLWWEAERLAGLPLEWGVPRLGRVADELHRARLVRWDQLHASVRALGKRGRAGTVLMREIAVERRPGSSVTESRNEDRLVALVADAGAPPLVPQPAVGDAEAPIGRTDFRDPELPMVAEVNSLTFQSTPSDRDDDRRRYTRLVAAGFAVAVVWEDDLWSNVREVATVVARARDAARRGRPTVLHTPSCPWPSDCRGPLWC